MSDTPNDPVEAAVERAVGRLHSLMGWNALTRSLLRGVIEEAEARGREVPLASIGVQIRHCPKCDNDWPAFSCRSEMTCESCRAEARGRKAGMEEADAELRNLRQKCVTGDARDSLLYIAQEAIRAAVETTSGPDDAGIATSPAEGFADGVAPSRAHFGASASAPKPIRAAAERQP